MLQQFILDLRNALGNHTFTETTLNDELLFVHEIEQKNELGKIVDKFTEMTNNVPAVRHFKFKNTGEPRETAHICIDGDFITFGQEKYNYASTEFSEGRPDSLVFNHQTLLFLELKVEQEEFTETKEDTKWKNYFTSAKQILDFVSFLRDNDFNMEAYYQNILAVVCFRFEPNFSVMSKSNTQRNSEILKVSQRLGFRLVAHNHQHIFDL